MWQMFSLAILRQTKQAMATLFKTAVLCYDLSTLFNTQSALHLNLNYLKWAKLNAMYNWK